MHNKEQMTAKVQKQLKGRTMKEISPQYRLDSESHHPMKMSYHSFSPRSTFSKKKFHHLSMLTFFTLSILTSFFHQVDAQNGMTLAQFQSVLRTFLDDEMAFIVHQKSSTSSRVFNETTEDVDDAITVAAESETNDFTALLEERVASIDKITTNGNRRRARRQRKLIKKNHHRNGNNDNNKDEESSFEEKRGRFHKTITIPPEVETAWDGIVSHAWDMAKLFSSSHVGDNDHGGDESTKQRGLKANKEKMSNDIGVIFEVPSSSSSIDESYDSEEDPSSSEQEPFIAIDEEVELETNWSEEIDSLFLACHSSTTPMSGNEHLEQILIASGKDVRVENEYFDVVHSNPKMVCVILGMQPTFAWAIGKKFREQLASGSSGSIALVPWVDVMKISPELFDSIMNINNDPVEDGYDDSSLVRGLRSFRRAQDVNVEAAPGDLFWDNAYVQQDSIADQYIVFSLVPPSTIENANSVMQDLIAMAANGRRRRLGQSIDDADAEEDIKDGHRRKLRKLSLHDAFSITKSAVIVNEGSSPSSSENHWSRILASGIESEHGCSSLMESIMIESSFDASSYEFQVSNDGNKSSPNPACVASLIAGLAVHPLVVNVGVMSKSVKLDNAGAQYAVQGAVTTNAGEWKRPYFDAGLDGSGQIVSVSDTGLDTKNCYFKDGTGDGDIFSTWDYSRRKVVKYDISPRGGDSTDIYRGHGSHVVGTVAGHHVLDETIGNGDDSKEGIAPGAKIHFFDIGLGGAVNDPREAWFSSFHDVHPKKGAKVATGSWGFGYRTSYDWVCRLYDQLLIDYPDVLYISSAGNSGNKFSSPSNTIGAPASCKNVFAVGATNNADFGSGLSYVVDFSSRGPTSDGRTKPDIMAPGYALDSASSGLRDCSTKESSYLKAGTSMAAPVVAGAGALVRQYFQEGWYPCGSKGCGEPMDPSGTLVKAVLSNGAQLLKGVQVGGTSTTIADQPVTPYDSNQNMGVTNLLTSLPLPSENDFNIFVQNDMAIGSGEETTFDFDINSSKCSSDFSATLTWYDPPATNGCTKCLVNDLDLLIENVSSSKKYFPNGASTRDILNNIERIRIGNTSTGQRYRVAVRANMLGPGYAEQRYSLVVTGCFNSAEEDTVTPPVTSQGHELVTTYSANRKQAGNMFGVKAKEDGVEITSFAIHTQASNRKVKLHVYTLNNAGGINGYEDFLDDPSKWTMISPTSGIEVDAMGFGSPTIIPAGSFEAVPIAKGTVQSFYITFVDEPAMLYKAVDNDYPTGATYISDKNIEIMAGVGKGVSFGRSWQSRQMNGAVFYSVSSSEVIAQNPLPTPNPTIKPSPSPTRRPTNKPTRRPTKFPTPNPTTSSNSQPSFPVLPLFMELETTYLANKKQAGNMFDVFAKKTVDISSFKIHTQLTTTVPVTIYTRDGSWENYDKDPTQWELVATVNVDCKGYGEPTIVSSPLLKPVRIKKGSTKAFYLTFDTPDMLYHYSSEYVTGSVFAQDASIDIMIGVGKSGRFGATYTMRQLNGALAYYVV